MDFNPGTYAHQLDTLLKQHTNASRASQQKKYLRNLFPFLGLTHPELNKHLATFIKANGLPPKEGLGKVSRLLYAMPEREFHHAAIRINERSYKFVPLEHINTLKWMITHQSWWDTVDYISKLVGLHLRRFPQIKNEIAHQWIQDKNLWLNRSAIIFQLLYKHETDEELLFELILQKADSSEFFIQKASGWALRQYSKVRPKAVNRFIRENQLANLTVREGMKYLNKQKKAQ